MRNGEEMARETDAGPANTLQTVERALSFIEVVAAGDGPTIKQVAHALGLNLTTCYHLLRTLVARGYVDRRNDGGLVLGARAGVVFAAFDRMVGMVRRLEPVVRRFAEDTSETCYLSVLENETVVLKALFEGSRNLRVGGLYVGLSGNEHARASGMAILASLPEERRAPILDRCMIHYTPEMRRTVRASLDAHYRKVVERGWTINKAMDFGDIWGLAAPVFGAEGEVFGAIGMVAPGFRAERLEDEYVRKLLHAAGEASGILRNASSGG